uniref:Recep_L_domain domain-containing protein n=1 Tax=Heterorhabditis bacteriophora TaxID=37862 RepID=A0A1I7XCY4_HETBA
MQIRVPLCLLNSVLDISSEGVDQLTGTNSIGMLSPALLKNSMTRRLVLRDKEILVIRKGCETRFLLIVDSLVDRSRTTIHIQKKVRFAN